MKTLTSTASSEIMRWKMKETCKETANKKETGNLWIFRRFHLFIKRKKTFYPSSNPLGMLLFFQSAPIFYSIVRKLRSTSLQPFQEILLLNWLRTESKSSSFLYFRMIKNKRIKKNWSEEDIKILIWVISKYSQIQRIHSIKD